MPAIYVCSWVLMITGPLLFPYAYQIYCFVIVGYSLLKTLGIGVSCMIAVYQLKKVAKKYQ